MNRSAGSVLLRNTGVVAAFLVFLFVGTPTVQSQEHYDTVILHGRVMDPESELDGVRNVGIRGGKIEAVTAKWISGKNTIDATGLVLP